MDIIEIEPKLKKLLPGSLPFALLFFAVAAGGVWVMGSANPQTPAGYVGYLTQGAILGKTRYVGLQTGPSSPGRTWMLMVQNVSVTPYTYSEDFSGANSVLSKDNLKIEFKVHIVWKVNPDRVQNFVEKYSTLGIGSKPEELVSVAYGNFLREPLRTFSRDEIQKLDGLKIKESITAIGQSVFAKVKALSNDTPFDVISVVVGNIQYPDMVASAVSEKMAATQVLERKRIEIEIEGAEAEKRVVQARGIAQATEIIQAKLTPQYLQHEAIEAQKAMAGSPNHTTVYIPTGPMGLPLVGTFDASSSANGGLGKPK